MGSLDEIDFDAWVDAITINLTGLAYCSRRAVAHFKPHRAGKIINLSGGGATNPCRESAPMLRPRLRSCALTETLALEVKDWNIDINAIAPGRWRRG
jgi:3-oxoacyl-[acyl-carrier protein] reductase